MKNIQLQEALLKRITIDPDVMTGKPVIRGIRLTVEHIVKSLAAGISFEKLKEDYPFLEKEDIDACLLYAAKIIEDEKIYFLKSA